RAGPTDRLPRLPPDLLAHLQDLGSRLRRGRLTVNEALTLGARAAEARGRLVQQADGIPGAPSKPNEATIFEQHPRCARCVRLGPGYGQSRGIRELLEPGLSELNPPLGDSINGG